MKRLEWLFHVLAFALQCGAFISFILRTDQSAAQLGAANPLNTIATAFVLVVTLFLVMRNPKSVFRYAPGMWPILCLTILALISASWSDYPNITVHRAGSLTTSTLWAWYVTARYEPKDLVAIIRQAMWLLAPASLAIGIVAPNLGRNDPLDPNAWRGVFATKNDLGIIMALGTVTFFYTLVNNKSRVLPLIFAGAGFVLCLGGLYLSQSRTAWLVGALGLILTVCIKLTHKRIGFAIIIWTAILLLLAPTVSIVTSELSAIAPLLGRDPQLTGRVDLWMVLPAFIADRLWLGHGFGAFWVAQSPDVSQIWAMVDWAPPHAHNGWLDAMLELGVCGLVLVTIQLIVVLVGGIRAVIDGRVPDIQYTLLTTFLLMFYNLAESNLVRPSVMWVLLVMAAAALSKFAKRRRAATGPRFSSRFQRRAPLASLRVG